MTLVLRGITSHLVTRGLGGALVVTPFRTATADLCVTVELDSDLCK